MKAVAEVLPLVQLLEERDHAVGVLVLARLHGQAPLHAYEALGIHTARALFSKAPRNSEYCPWVWSVIATELSRGSSANVEQKQWRWSTATVSAIQALWDTW